MVAARGPLLQTRLDHFWANNTAVEPFGSILVAQAAHDIAEARNEKVKSNSLIFGTTVFHDPSLTAVCFVGRHLLTGLRNTWATQCSFPSLDDSANK